MLPNTRKDDSQATWPNLILQRLQMSAKFFFIGEQVLTTGIPPGMSGTVQTQCCFDVGPTLKQHWVISFISCNKGH